MDSLLKEVFPTSLGAVTQPSHSMKTLDVYLHGLELNLTSPSMTTSVSDWSKSQLPRRIYKIRASKAALELLTSIYMNSVTTNCDLITIYVLFEIS